MDARFKPENKQTNIRTVRPRGSTSPGITAVDRLTTRNELRTLSRNTPACTIRVPKGRLPSRAAPASHTQRQ